MTARYRVEVRRTTTEHEWAWVEVEATEGASDDEVRALAVEKAEAIEMGDLDGELDWSDYGSGYGGWEITATDEPIESVENA